MHTATTSGKIDPNNKSTATVACDAFCLPRRPASSGQLLGVGGGGQVSCSDKGCPLLVDDNVFPVLLPGSATGVRDQALGGPSTHTLPWIEQNSNRLSLVTDTVAFIIERVQFRATLISGTSGVVSQFTFYGLWSMMMFNPLGRETYRLLRLLLPDWRQGLLMGSPLTVE